MFRYAHILSFKKDQCKIGECALPQTVARHLQSELIAEAPVDAGYVRISFDHFDLPRLEILPRRSARGGRVGTSRVTPTRPPKQIRRTQFVDLVLNCATELATRAVRCRSAGSNRRRLRHRAQPEAAADSRRA